MTGIKILWIIDCFHKHCGEDGIRTRICIWYMLFSALYRTGFVVTSYTLQSTTMTVSVYQLRHLTYFARSILPCHVAYLGFDLRAETKKVFMLRFKLIYLDDFCLRDGFYFIVHHRAFHPLVKSYSSIVHRLRLYQIINGLLLFLACSFFQCD